MRDAVSVVADQRPIRREHRVAVTRSNQHSPHLQHPPRAVEGLLYAALALDDSRVQLAQHVVHLAHPPHELVVPDEIGVEALDRRARESHRRDGHDLGDLLQNYVRQTLNACEPLGALEPEQSACADLLVLLVDPRSERHWLSDHDRRAAVPLPPARNQAREIPPCVAKNLAELHVAGRALPSLTRIELTE